MSSVTLLMLFASGPVAGPMPDGAVIGHTASRTMCANDADPDAIVVCGQRAGPSPRLPMREDRFAEGEVVRHPSDGARQDPGPRYTPSRLGETLGKAFAGVRSLITGEDAGF